MPMDGDGCCGMKALLSMCQFVVICILQWIESCTILVTFGISFQVSCIPSS